jgi:hypothetical protein
MRVLGKGNKKRVMPLPPEIIEVLEKYLRLERPLTNSSSLFVSLKGRQRGRAMTPAGLRSLFRHHRLRSRVPQANAHRLRHTFGADMVRAGIAGSARSKKIQMWPPFPERERSKAAGTFNSWQVSRKARESYSQVILSKSAARNQHVSSGRRGYTPTVSLPKRWFSMTASVSGMNFCVFRSTFFLPSPCVDIFSPAKQASKERDSLSGSLCLVHRRRRLDAFGWRWILRRQLRNRDAVNRKKSPQTSIFLPETNVFLLWRLEWKRL